jgi:pyruvate/2-oxoglutarate dehydrogenase complex dihydrolipoamide dehydrogenase (E3) component
MAKIKKSKYDYDLIVIGSGAGGSVAADIVASAGKRVAIIEADDMGGQTSGWGDIPTKALLEAARAYNAARGAGAFGIRAGATGFNYPSIRAWKDLAIKRTGVEGNAKYYQSRGIGVYRGQAHFISPHEITINRRHLSAEYFLIATGADWKPLDGTISERVTVLNPRTALDLTKPPKTLFIIGGGATGTEFAELFASFGSRVIIADEASRILPKEDQEVSQLVEAVFTKRRSIRVLSKAKVTGISYEGISPRVEYLRGGEAHSLKADQVLVAVGKAPMVDIGLENAGVTYSDKGIDTNEWLQTSVSHIYAAGDVLGEHMYTHVGVFESRIVANNILHKNKAVPDYKAVPRVTFLTPEVASVGKSEEDCLKRDMTIKTAVVPINTTARANVSNSLDGFVKVITDRRGVLIGGSVVSAHAGEVIHELALAIQYGLTASQVAATIHAFPTWSEALRVACGKINV